MEHIGSPLTPVAQAVAENRYFQKDVDGKCIEDWDKLVRRVVNHVCAEENNEFVEQIYDLMYSTKFLPNSPCLVNAGTKVGGLLACFVSKSPEDSWIGMMENLANFGHIARRGGGCGVDFSEIRPEGDPVFGSTHARACGPIKHMIVASEAMNSITQAGFRGMANMGVLRVDHPDVLNFIACKQRSSALRHMLREDIFDHYGQMTDPEGKIQTQEHANILLDKFLSNFNISILATDEFMQAVEEDDEFELRFGGKGYRSVKALAIFNAIVENAWRNGDPGLLFYDTVNNGPYKHSKQTITATNPCGEQPLPQWGSCNLGSIDVSKFYNEKTSAMNWKGLRAAIETAVRFLDCVIDINLFPTPEFGKWAKKNRPVGLGIMGLADLLLKAKISYGSEESIKFAEKLAKFFRDTAHDTSVALGREKGTPESCQFDELDHRRNATTLTIAPTGSIGLLAGCSGGIEPIFAPVTFRYDNTGQYEIPHHHANKSYFRCALDKEQSGKREVPWQDHINIQAAFQKYVDSSISKTINMPSSATTQEVAAAYMQAWKQGCKGITIYRDGCKSAQVLNTDRQSIPMISARSRPKEVRCNIHKTSALGCDWHVIIGTLDSAPYELFAVNGKIDLPETGVISKKKKRHYSLLAENDSVLIDNLNATEEQIDDRLGLETRRFSLELRHGIHPKFIVQQIDKSNECLTSFSRAVGRIFKRYYLSPEDCCAVAIDIACPACAQRDEQIEMIPKSGCWECPKCHYAQCG